MRLWPADELPSWNRCSAVTSAEPCFATIQEAVDARDDYSAAVDFVIRVVADGTYRNENWGTDAPRTEYLRNGAVVEITSKSRLTIEPFDADSVEWCEGNRTDDCFTELGTESGRWAHQDTFTRRLRTLLRSANADSADEEWWHEAPA